jgi:uncharacterized repeat protein (TIGR03806 family)
MHKLLLLLVATTCIAACERSKPPVTLFSAEHVPAKLSEWGVVFASGTSLELNEGVIPFSLNTPLFTDYALKLRTVWMPAGTSAKYLADGPMDFPVGTIISKTFHYEKAAGFSSADYRVAKADREATLDDLGGIDLDHYLLVETRLLVHYADGWKALPYVWNANQDEAFLEIAGDIRKIELVDSAGSNEFIYVVPDSNQCAGCHVTDHASKRLQPIGPKAWQLNRQYDYGASIANQLEHWEKLGILSGLTAERPAAVSWSAPGNASLDQRARAYLDINCAHCHNASGSADTSGLDLHLNASTGREFGICKPPVAVGRGSGDRPYDIFPGHPDDSILLYRMQRTEPDIAMPELGRSTVHTEAVALIRQWISAMDGDC